MTVLLTTSNQEKLPINHQPQVFTTQRRKGKKNLGILKGNDILENTSEQSEEEIEKLNCRNSES